MKRGLLRNLFSAVLFGGLVPALRAAAAPYDPVADPAAVVRDGTARFTVLTDRLVRLEWAANGRFEDRPSLVFLNRRLPVPAFRVSRDGTAVTVTTDALVLRYAPRAGGDGRFDAGDLSVTLRLDGRPVLWHPEDPDSGNLLGTTRTLDRAYGGKTLEPIGPGLISRGGWVLVDDSKRPLFTSDDFTFRKGEQSPWPWVMERPPGARQDWYFFGYGHDYRGALGAFVRVAGRIPIPPRFAFGAWWSRYWAYTDQELEDLVQGFHENDTPLDVLVIDMDWHDTRGMHFKRLDASGHTLGWTGYTWNPLYFPYPEAFLAEIHRQGLKVTLNLHPASGIQPWEKAYPAMARAMGIDPATQRYVPFDITNERFARNYFDLVLHPLERQGVDFWWIDWQQEPTTRMPGVNPTWWLNYVHFTDQEREGKRPLLFHRWGGLGNHRYEIGFSGDVVSSWPSLAFQPWFTATAANVGYAYWSHDIGGHIPGKVDPELYTRWVQFGAFSPILRTHTTKNALGERRIWAYPEPYSSIMRRAFQLRYALEPYLYTEARRTYDTGVAFLRPLYYDWPERDAAYAAKGEYRFGDSMIAAPVTAPVDPASALATETVWVPPGRWVEWPTGRWLDGPATVSRRFSLSQIPVYLRAGAIVPMQRPMSFTGQKPVDPLIITLFPMPDGAEAAYTLYEDGGEDEAYQRGVAAWTPIHARESGDELTVRIDPVKGAFPGMLRTRSYELRLPFDWPPMRVTEAGRALGWRFDGNTLTTIIDVPSEPVTRAVEIQVRRAAGLVARRAELDGFPGKMTRLREAYDAVNLGWPKTHSPDVLTDAMQTGDRLSYHPETIERELSHLRLTLPGALAAVRGMNPQAAALLGDAR